MRGHRRVLARGAALLLVCGSAAGCSSTATRLGGLDGLFTGSTGNAAAPVQASASAPVAPLMPAPASPVTRSALAAPVSSAPLPPPSAAAVPPRSVASPVSAAAPKLAAGSSLPAGVKKLGSPESKTPLPSAAPTQRVAALKPASPAAKAEAAKKAEVLKPAAGGATYTVAAGDSLNKIAKKTGVAVAELRAANGIGPEGITVGQTLKLSASAAKKTEAVAKAAAPALDPIQTASSPSKAPVEPVSYTPPQPASQVLKQAESEPSAEAPEESGAGKMRWPVRGRVVGKFGAKGSQSSEGLDIAVPEGTPVKAAENGVVIYAGNGLKEFGNTVLVRHDNGLVTVYGHASQIKVTRGEKVTRGQDIALSGMSGTTDTPKLHFEVRKNSAPVDPSTYLQ